MAGEREILTNKDLANGTTRRKAKDIPPDGRVAAHKSQGALQLSSAAACDDVHAQPAAQTGLDEIGAEEEVQARDDSAHHVVCAHHLRARVGPKGGKDVVLGRVGQAVKEQVDAEQQQTPGCLARRRPARRLLLVGAAVQRKDGYAGRDGRDDQVLVHGVALAEERDVQEHDGQ